MAECPKGEHSEIVSRVTRTEDDIQRMWETLEKIRNRLPLWAVLGYSLLSGALGSTLTVIAVLMKIRP